MAAAATFGGSRAHLERDVSARPLPWLPAGSIDGWTIPSILQSRARHEPGTPALREKWLGRYDEYDWAELWRQVSDVALGLIELGLERGERVAIMGDPCREYVFAELAVWLAGGVSLGVYPTSSPSEVLYHVNDSGATIFIAEDQEHLDKLLVSREELPPLKAIVVIDPRTLFLYRESVVTFEDVQRTGASRSADDPTLADELAQRVAPDDPACLIYTSGTTGGPKGVLHTHRTLLWATRSLVVEGLQTSEQRSVLHLPIAHVVGKILTLTLPLLTRVVPHLPEHVDVFSESLFEVSPTYVMQPPRFFEKLAAQLLVSIETSSRAKRGAYAAAMKVARARLPYKWRRERVPFHLEAAYRLARALVFVPLLRQIGYHKLRHAYTGSAAVPPEVATVWQAWGVDLRIMYGLTESGGIITAHADPFPEPTDIGQLLTLPGWEMRIASDGELLFRGPSLFVEYWGKPEATAETLVDGWLHTGDVVEVTDRGLVKLIDRKKDIVVTSGGKSLSPQQIENEIKASPYISEAIVFAEGRNYVSALLELDYLTVADWARAHKLPYGSYADLVTHPDVRALIEEEVASGNARLSRVEQVKRFEILSLELDPEAGEVTPTRKVKRRLMADMFHDLIESMYQGGAAGAIQAQVGSVAGRRQAT